MGIVSLTHPVEASPKTECRSARRRFILPSEHPLYPIIGLVAALILVARIAPTVDIFNHTVDEPIHLAAGVSLWQEKKLTLGADHPPLAWLVSGAVPYLMGVRLPAEYDSQSIAEVQQAMDAGGKILFDGGHDYWTILTGARLAMLIFPLAALFYLYQLTRWVAHGREAMLATVFFSLDPTLLGHAMWIVDDAAAAAGFLAASYYGLRFLRRPTAWRALAGGAAVGIAIACKTTGLLMLPALALILLIRPIRALGMDLPWRRRLRAYFRRWPTMAQAGLFILAAFIALWGTYLFDVSPLANQTLIGNSRHWEQIPAWVKQMPIPMPSFVAGTFFQLSHNNIGHHAYLNGKLSFNGWWYYFPEAFALKSPIGLLAALVVSICLAGGSYLMVRRRISPRSLVYVIPLAFLAISMRSPINIGVRLLLPAIPFAYLFVAVQLGRRRGLLVLIPLMALAAVETAWVHPEYIAYFNALAGGPSGGRRYLADSNLDWGQDIARLATWLKSDANRGRSYSLRVDDTEDAKLVEYLGLDPAALSAKPHGLFAISVNNLARLQTFSVGPDYSWLDAYPMVKRVGESIYVYDLDQKP